MSPTPLHQLAEDGRAELRERAERADPDLARQVRGAIAAGAKLTVNMKPSSLEPFLDGEPRMNMFEWADREADRLSRPATELLRERLKEWYGPRIEFEQRCGAGRHFHYGALNVGGMGSPRFGRYCVVDGRAFAGTAPDPIWVAEDSLRATRFRGPDDGLEWSALARWVATTECAADLAIAKFDDLGPSGQPIDLRICSSDDYIEGLSLKPVVVSDVEEIRSDIDDDLQRRALTAALEGSTPAVASDGAMP